MIERFLRVSSVAVESSLPFLAARAVGLKMVVGGRGGAGGRGCDALKAGLEYFQDEKTVNRGQVVRRRDEFSLGRLVGVADGYEGVS